MALISVIVPNYNHAKYLRQRLDSIFHQTFQDFEVILLDDASTDESVHILEEYRGKYTPKVSHLIVNDMNSGSPFKQWEKGIKLAKGEYIWIAESDDFCEVYFLERLIDCFKHDKKLVASFCNSIIFREASYDGSMYLLNDPICSAGVYKGNIILKNWLLKMKGPFIGNSSCAVIKSNIIKERLDLKTLGKFQFAGDKYFWMSILNDYNCYYVSEPYNSFRQHQSNTSLVKVKDSLKTIRNTIENYYLFKRLDSIINLDSHEKQFLESEKVRHINQISNRTNSYFAKVIGKFFKFIHPYL